MDINSNIGRRVRTLRAQQGLSLEALGERSGVSRSNISLIERGQTSPTAVVLDKLATALNVSVAALFETDDGSTVEPSPLARRVEQTEWVDPDTGYVRRTLSPATHAPIQLIEVLFPPGKRIAYETTTREVDIHQQLWMLEGVMEITMGDTSWRVEAGDCLAMRRDVPVMFRNRSRTPARYLMALTTLPISSGRRTS
jgi:transcriptional regulator with XRE-family HTH domain